MLVDNGQGPRMEWIIPIVIAPIKMVIDDDHRVAVVAERTPSDIIIATIPMNPGWPPIPSGYPVPAKAPSPMPTSVVINTPSPRLIGDPGPSDDWIPNPSPVKIRPPFMMSNVRNPHISIGTLINPPSVISQFCLIFRQF